MATVEEKFRGVSGDYTNRSVEFIVKNASNEGDAITETVVYVMVNYGGQIDGLPLQNVSVEEISYPKGIFKTTAQFGKIDDQEKDTGTIEFNFDVNMDTRRIYRSIETVSGATQYVRPGGKAKPLNGRINVNSDGIADGTDIRIPVPGFQVTWYAPVASVTDGYKVDVLNLVGTINDSTFYGFDRGEVMFTGASGRQRNIDDWELSYRFEVHPNVSDQTIGESPDQITGIDVEGWNFLHVRYERQQRNNDAGDKIDVFVPEQAYVERIYEYGNFALLGIGT